MKKIILGLSLCLICVVSASAQRYRQDNPPNEKNTKHPPPVAELLKKMDTNKDGKLSKKEVKGPLKKDFKKMDTNKDGKLSKKEVKGPLKKDFKKVDANKDGFLTKVELEKMPPPPRERQGPPRE